MRVSLRSRILFSYTVLIIVTFMGMIFFVNKSVYRSNENIVLSEMSGIDRDVKLYIRQYCLLNNISDLKSEFMQRPLSLLEDLNTKMIEKGVLYFADGRVAGDVYGMDGYWDKREDLELALKKESATTLYLDDENVYATFSIPVLSENKLVGVYRFSRDYMKLYDAGRSFVKTISLFAMIAGVGIIGISLLISHNILQPLLKLRDYSVRLANSDFEVEINISSADEIGDLARHFSIMKNRIHLQMQELHREHEKLRQLESYRKQFFDNVTHELKTPLTVISGFAQMIEETDFSDRELLVNGTGHIRKESQRLHQIVMKLLDASRIASNGEGASFEEFDVSHLLISVCEDMDVKAVQNGLKINTNISPGIYVYGNREDLRSAFVNIIDNAIKYGRVDTSIQVSAFHEGEAVSITVRDYGIGIPEALQDKVFEPFFRGMPDKVKKTESSGLGLFLVKQIVDNHHGTIRISSVEQRGTTVQMHIPVKCLHF